MKWLKTSESISGDGSITIRYKAYGTDLVIEARSRRLKNNGFARWTRMEFYLVFPDGTEKNFMAFSDARRAAERAIWLRDEVNADA